MSGKNRQNMNRRGKKAKKRNGSKPYVQRVQHGLQAFPPRMRSRLTWNKGFALNNVGAIFSNTFLEPTYMYNLDGTGASSIPFFGEMTTVYRFYRVRSWNLKVHFSNLETFNVLCYLLPINSSPGNNNAAWQSYLSNPLCKHFQVGPLTGMNTKTITSRASVAMFGGSLDTKTDDLYSGTSLGVAPTNNVFHIVGINSPTGVVFANGVTISMFINIDVEFFELNTPAT